MKRMFAVVRRPVICLLVMMGGATLASSTELVDPTEFVLLEVGNRWTYRHSYLNGMYQARDIFWQRWEEFWELHGRPDEEAVYEEEAYWKAYFKQFEVPGYPMGESHPPESLTRTYPDEVTLVIEITHTEWIDGFEYFVFSEASYDWPPLPAFFWAGQKVRLSEDGILLFHRNGADIPLYDFNPRHTVVEIPSEWYNTSTSASVFGYISVGINRWRMRDRLTRDHWDAVINPAYRGQILEVGFHFSNPMEHTLTDWSVLFVKGYGIGRFEREKLGAGNRVDFYNGLYPISAILSGKEVSYEDATSKFFVLEPELPPIVGQRSTMRNNSGFDFSEGTNSYPLFFDHDKDDIELYQSIYPEDGFAASPSSLRSPIGMADLGQVDFGRLVSEGPADLRPDPDSRSMIPQEGHSYAFWTQEGGIALMHILPPDIDLFGLGYGERIDHILFDWVYYPVSGRLPNATSVQSTSWGQLKDSLLRME